MEPLLAQLPAILMATCCFLVLVWYKSWLRAVLLALSLPGPPALPILGNIFIIKDGKEFTNLGKTVLQKYGTLIRGWLTILPIILVFEPKHLQKILGNSRQSQKNFLYAFMHTFIGQGLITSNGYKWKSHRKYIQPYFDAKTLAMFVPTFEESASVTVDELKGKNEVKITSCVNRCILNILHQSVLGIPIDDREIKEKSPFTKGHVTLTERVLRPWLLLDTLYSLTFSAKAEFKQKLTLQQFALNILEQRRQDRKRGKTLQWCLLDVLIEIADGNSDFTDKDIVDEVCTFMLAGQDSVGAAVAFTLYYLAENPEIQTKVFQEVTDVMHVANVTVDVLNNLKYLEQCLKETMRLCPSVPIIARKLSEDVNLGKHTIPAGTNVFVSPFVTHRLPEIYPDPEKFDPERFIAKTQEKRNPYAFIPFSAGPRNCLGYKFAMLEMKVIVSTILRHFKLSPVPGYKMELVYRITLRAKGGIPLKLTPR